MMNTVTSEINIFRWYRAGWGRYTQADPMEWVGQEFPYASVNPLSNTDALGLYDTGSAAKDAIRRAINACGEKTESAWGGPAIGAILMLLQADDANPVEFENRIKKCNKCDTRKCRPCISPVGTLGYREDTKPTSPPHRGVPPPHSHLYEMHQSPRIEDVSVSGIPFPIIEVVLERVRLLRVLFQ